MASSRKLPPTQKDFRHVWHVRDWMAVNNKRQVDMIDQLGWSKAKASEVMNGRQYTQSLIDELAPWLNAKPFELLMAPAEAMAIRQMRNAAVQIVADNRAAEQPQFREGEPPAQDRPARRAS